MLDLAGDPAVRRRFGFDDDDLERLRDWVAGAAVRWGLDGEHRGTWRSRASTRAPGGSASTACCSASRWRAATPRGRASPRSTTSTAATSSLAGRLAGSSTASTPRASLLAGTHTVAEWAEGLEQAVTGLALEPWNEAWQRLQAQQELAALAGAAGDAPALLTLDDVRTVLAEPAGRPPHPGEPSAPAPSPSARWCPCARCRTGWSCCSGSTTARSRGRARATATTCWRATPGWVSATVAARTGACCSTP
ncbi:hypothetical protein GCM10025868_24770 [Angustibacter aerolatus]|uniref:Uncharacterized protein n=1 Tax=Angustibacter aerolatus TaxID=1162965 RepID=A0ABQ6JK28_9ACTN|nr:hypothetical protein GCM10025868_24770 [Angustibacter aerolatus]